MIARNLLKFYALVFACCLTQLASAQYVGYSLSSAGVRIYDASQSVLSEIQKVPEIENRLVQLGDDISQNDFESICSKFKWIVKLSIETTNITDISAVKKLKNLTFFQIKNGLTADSISLASLADVETLREISIVNTAVKDYESLSCLVELERATFEKSTLTSLDFLANMKSLKKLNISGANHTFKNYDTLGALNQLTHLDVSYNPQANSSTLDVFSDVPTLTNVSVSHCENLSSVTFLYSSLSRIKELYAVDCQAIGNFDVLMRATKLQKIDVSGSSIKNIAFLANKINLKDVNLARTNISSIAELAPSVAIERLDVSHTAVSDVAVIGAMSKLKKLNISYTQVADLLGLAGCLALTDLNASHSQLASLEGAEHCEKLTKINLGYTPVKDLKPLYSAKKITSLIVNEDVTQVHLEALKRRSPLIVIDFVREYSSSVISD